MIQTGIFTRVVGYTTREGAINKYAPDGTLIVEFTLGVGGGSEKYPVQWVKVTVWEKVAEKALKIINGKGIAVEVSGMLLVREYEGKHGRSVAIDLKNVREFRIYDRDGELKEVISGEPKE